MFNNTTALIATLRTALITAFDGPNSGLGLGSRPLKAAAEGRRDELRRMINHLEGPMAAKIVRANRNPHRFSSIHRQIHRMQRKFELMIPAKSPKRKATKKVVDESVSAGEE